MHPDGPPEPEPADEDEESGQRRVDTTASAVEAGSWSCAGCDWVSCDWVNCDWVDCDGGGCDGCDCNFALLRVSTLLLVAAAVVPDVGGGALVRALIRGYRRRLTRFTPRCPSSPSCSAYALAAVESLGARRGLVAAARRVRECGERRGNR